MGWFFPTEKNSMVYNVGLTDLPKSDQYWSPSKETWEICAFHGVPIYTVEDANQFIFSYLYNSEYKIQLVDFTIKIFLQINISFNFDETFILEEESDFVEDIVAPLYLSNLEKDVQDNAELYLKLNAIFSFVLYNNLIGMIPYSDTATSSLILTFWVALSVFGSLIYILLKMHGVHYFFALFMPSGSPLALAFLLIPIEFISYVFRVVNLSVRFPANMFAGHTLLKVIVGFSWSMLLLVDVFLIINLFSMGILFLLTFLEIGVAIVQAYIFTTLTALYLKDLFVAH